MPILKWIGYGIMATLLLAAIIGIGTIVMIGAAAIVMVVLVIFITWVLKSFYEETFSRPQRKK